MRTKCYSVRLLSLTEISRKAFKAIAFDGSSAIIPKSQVFGDDTDVDKCQAYWIASWFLEKSNLQYSTKKSVWFDSHGKMHPDYTVTVHIPSYKPPIQPLPDETLTRKPKELL